MEVRTAFVADAQAIARVHVNSWQRAYAGILPATFLSQLSVERRTQGWSRILGDPQVDTYVALCNVGSVVAFASLQSSRDNDALASTGELTSIYVTPDEWGNGYGRALMDAVIERARDRRFKCITLWVLESNRRAERFYRVVGFRADGAKKTETRGKDVILHEVRYRLEI